MKCVGIRELKDKLSGYLKDVQQGQSLTVMERKRAVAILIPIDDDPDIQKARELTQKGMGDWSGGKPKGTLRPATLKGKSVSQMVLEDRG